MKNKQYIHTHIWERGGPFVSAHTMQIIGGRRKTNCNISDFFAFFFEYSLISTLRTTAS